MSEFPYDAIRNGIQSSAAVCVPMILNSLTGQGVEAPRVLDVGAGEGWWSDALFDHGAAQVDAIDHPTPSLTAEGVTIQDVNLEGEYTLARGYDLALCLEVAEHLSAPAGDELVRQLCRAARAVAWSAAIPGQGGTLHVNEQWPAYWEERFARHGYTFLDPWRMALWGDDRVEPWYQQNLLLAVPGVLEGQATGNVPPIVHPDIFRWRVAERDTLWAQDADARAEVANLRARIGAAHAAGWLE